MRTVANALSSHFSRSRATLVLTALMIGAVAGGCAFGSSDAPEDRVTLRGTLEAGFNCAVREVNERDFVVVDASRDSGFLRAERDRTGLTDALLGDTRVLDQLTVSLYRDASERTVMRVTAERVEVPTAGASAGARIAGPGTAEGRAAATEILEACAAASS
jgi:hypothetical protein